MIEGNAAARRRSVCSLPNHCSGSRLSYQPHTPKHSQPPASSCPRHAPRILMLCCMWAMKALCLQRHCLVILSSPPAQHHGTGHGIFALLSSCLASSSPPSHSAAAALCAALCPFGRAWCGVDGPAIEAPYATALQCTHSPPTPPRPPPTHSARRRLAAASSIIRRRQPLFLQSEASKASTRLPAHLLCTTRSSSRST